MAFEDIEILDFDEKGIELIAGTENRVEVPYILSNAPPKEWKRYFESRWPNPQHLHIVDAQIKVPCRMDITAVRKNGECWNLVEKWVAEANRHCREIDAQKQKERAKEEEAQQHENEQLDEFEEFKRNLRRRH